MSYDGRAVANFVLDFCESRQCRITNLALQKVVFFCHAWSLIKFQKPLVKHSFEAWKYGPVLQYLYHEFKVFDERPIEGRAKSINPATGKRQIAEYKFDSATEDLLNNVVGFYIKLSTSELVRLSHAKDGPWYKAWHHQSGVNPGMLIENSEVVEFYSKMHAPFAVQ